MAVLTLYFSFSSLKNIWIASHLNETYFETSIIEGRVHYKNVSNIPTSWVPLKQISKKLQGAIISSEDGKFYMHQGFDSEQIQKVVDENIIKKRLKAQKKIRGASTITQQLAKNLFLNFERSYSRKIKEMAYTIILEKNNKKETILEAYLNIIEFGENIYGIKNASQFYFKKLPSELNARESAFLAMLLPSPKKYMKSFKQKYLTPFALSIVESVLLKMRQGGYISENEYLTSLNTRMSFEKLNNNQLEQSVYDLKQDFDLESSYSDEVVESEK